MMRRTGRSSRIGVVPVLSIALLAGVIVPPGAAVGADGVDLRVNKGPAAGQLTLTWTGGQPLFDLYRASGPAGVVSAPNYVTSTAGSSLVTGLGSETLACFVVTSPCVVNPPEVCNGVDDDCNGTVDDPGASASCSVPNATAACTAGNCVVGSCDPGYADCDLLAANGCERDVTTFQTDPLHCGGCNQVCPDPPNASPGCFGGSCGVVCDPGFADCDLSAGNGCEVALGSSPNHCGACNNVCPARPNAATTCTASTCGYSCDLGFSDCDGSPANGCEVNDAAFLTDSFNCGGCGVTCTLPNGVGVCAGGSCQSAVAFCDADFWDIDGNGANGCEYACTFVSANDPPDDSFIDANCDGVDGNASDGIFVSPAGNDGAAGTRAAPKATPNAAISAAFSSGKSSVFLDEGIYFGQVNLTSGISLYGGYRRTAGWSRSASFVSEIRNGTPVGGRVTGIDCVNAVLPTRIDRVRVVTQSVGSPGVSQYGVRASGCSGLVLHAAVVIAAQGSAGVAGGPGGVGVNGAAGSSGAPGSCDGLHGVGGGGGGSPCGRLGGAGGRGGFEGANNGVAGSLGTGGSAGGSGGMGGDPGLAGGNGQSGAAGTAGSNGAPGSGGSVVADLWSGAAGANGGPGGNGNGGGGGGGGGGQGCTFCDNGGGNGGGGAGGGGCGATGGDGGTAGGGSFGVFLVSSTGATIENSSITSGAGGTGGAGGFGGPGGAGGAGAPGGSVCTGEVGRGGQGGSGGAGGSGGHGGGAAGGPSFAIYRAGTTVTLSGNSLANGPGGAGGPSPGNPGVAGASGTLF